DISLLCDNPVGKLGRGKTIAQEAIPPANQTSFAILVIAANTLRACPTDCISEQYSWLSGTRSLGCAIRKHEIQKPDCRSIGALVRFVGLSPFFCANPFTIADTFASRIESWTVTRCSNRQGDFGRLRHHRESSNQKHRSHAASRSANHRSLQFLGHARYG